MYRLDVPRGVSRGGALKICLAPLVQRCHLSRGTLHRFILLVGVNGARWCFLSATTHSSYSEVEEWLCVCAQKYVVYSLSMLNVYLFIFYCHSCSYWQLCIAWGIIFSCQSDRSVCVFSTSWSVSHHTEIFIWTNSQYLMASLLYLEWFWDSWNCLSTVYFVCR